MLSETALKSNISCFFFINLNNSNEPQNKFRYTNIRANEFQFHNHQKKFESKCYQLYVQFMK